MNKRSMICSQLYKYISMSYLGLEFVPLYFTESRFSVNIMIFM